MIWACEKFTDYILGRHFKIETDHKLLIPLLSKKQLDSIPPRIIRFRLRLAKFNYSICHVPRKLLYTADALSRAPTGKVEENSLQEEAEALVESVVESLPTSPQRLDVYKTAQEKDFVCHHLKHYCRSGWPAKSSLTPELLPYWKERGHFSENSGLLMYNHRIVVPQALQSETLQKVHAGHQGIEHCRARVKQSV